MTTLAYAGSPYGASINRYRSVGLVLIGVFGASFLIWATMAPLSSAVIAAGRLEVTGSVKKIQHPTGGTISSILVRDGETVAEGQLLVTLDATMVRANLEIIEGKLDELWMTSARLKAERDGLAGIVLPPYFAGREQDPDVCGMSLDCVRQPLIEQRYALLADNSDGDQRKECEGCEADAQPRQEMDDEVGAR